MAIRILLIFTLIIPFSRELQGHPHLFIKPAVEIIRINESSDGIRIFWEWDRWWSREVIRECDTDRNGRFDNKEIDIIYKDFFSALRNFSFFTGIQINGRRLRINSVTQFHAEIGADEIVSYSFVIPLNSSINSPTNIRIFFNDETIYTAFDRTIGLAENPFFSFSNIDVSNYSHYGISMSLTVTPTN